MDTLKPVKAKPAAKALDAKGAAETLRIEGSKHTRENLARFSVLIVGDTPLITHAWSQKAKQQMLLKQKKETTRGRDAKSPESDFLSALYEMPGDGVYGFPAMGVKNCIINGAHKDKNVPKTLIQSALFIEGEWTRTAPGLTGAICDMPLLRIWGAPPEMREDMVKVGAGLNKTATLAYRPQFMPWAMEIRGLFNSSVLTIDALVRALSDSGIESGIGDWRNERHGMFGSFHIADPDEQAEWGAFMAGNGPLPAPKPVLV